MESLPLLVAFGFASPWMLWGAALGGIPIIIHLLHRQQYRETTWAAMRFLAAAIRKQSQRMRLEQWLLLAVRTAILLCIALALAGPTLQSTPAFVPAGGHVPTQRILLIDASLSMSVSEAGRSRLDRAKELARKFVQSSRQGDTWSLIRVGQASPMALIRRPTPQFDAVLKELDQLAGLEETADWATALSAAEEMLRQDSDAIRKEVCLLTDLQATNWQPADASALARLRQSLRKLSAANVHVYPIAGGDAANAAVTSMQVSGGLHLSRNQNLVRVGLKRFGASDESQTVEFRVDDRLQETRTVDVPLGQETFIDWLPNLTAGEHRLEARLASDSLMPDNRAGGVINVQDRLPVLLVNGKPSGEAWENATDLLQLALAPDANSPFAPTVIPESELLSTPLAPYACVFLCNLALITDREARWLEDYLQQGGAVVLCVGSQVRIEQYNQSLLAKDRAILPGRLVERVGDPKSTQTAFEFDPGDFSHPILKPFQGNPNSGLELTKTFAYLRMEIDPDRGAQVALKFQTGDPAIVTAPFGPGQVVVITTSVDREWSTWAVWGHSFVPLMHEIVRFAAADRFAGRQLLVGQPLSGIAESDAVRTAEVTNPSGETTNVEVVQRQVSFEPTLRSGFYELRWGPPASRSTWYAVNVDPSESDPASLDESSLKGDYPETAQWQFHDDQTELPVSAGFGAPVASGVSATQPWSRPLLLAALWLMLAEQGLAWRFFIGVSVLTLGVGLVVVQWLLGMSVWLAAAGVVLACAGVLIVFRQRGMKFR